MHRSLQTSDSFPGRLLGAHLSVGRGWEALFRRARALGCNCVQIFGGNPRGWQGKPVNLRSAAECGKLAQQYGVRELILHAIYLVNLASPRAEVARKSLRVLRRDFITAQRLGVRRIIMHPGSDLGQGGGEQRLEKNLHALLPKLPLGCCLLLEGMAGRKAKLGQLPFLGRLARRLGPRVGVCLDTAHLSAQGFDFSGVRGLQKLDQVIRKYVGYRRIGCVHLNDSRSVVGSGRDLHENLGEGSIGKPGLIRLLAHPGLRHLPFILETPGFNQQGPDHKNMRRLQQYALAADEV